MKTLEKGVYTAKVDPQTLARLNGELRARCAELTRQSDIEHYNAQLDIIELRNRRRIDPETGMPYIP